MVTEDGVPESRWVYAANRFARNVSSAFLLCPLLSPLYALICSRKQNLGVTIDVSREAQLRDIEASFAAVENSELSALRHPTRPELTAVEAFEIFPDADIWANAYDLFRFSERPGDRPPDVCFSTFT